MLQITNACKTFGETIVFKQINLTLPAQSILGLAGSSGGGKSTLLRCIQNLEPLSSGSIKVNGEIGFMFQDFQLFPHFNVLKNITYALHFKTDANNAEQIAIILLTKLGLLHKATCFPHQLSGGQKQRVALARSLAMQPTLLLCDEPTSGLDFIAIDDVIELLQTIKEMGVSMIIASHDLAFITRISDRIIVLNDGAVAADFNPSTVSEPIHYLKNRLTGEYND